jgi:hypothetical protein
MKEEQYKELFLFAAKAGALEGYLFHRQEVEPLANWVDNIGRMYDELSPEVKREVAPVVAPVLERALEYGDKVLEPGFKEKLQQLLVAAGKAA